MLERLQNRLGLQTIPGIFFTSAGIAALFVVLAVPFDQQVADSFGVLTGWVARNLGWFYILAVSSLLIFLLGLAVSRYGNIRLGADDSRPDYSNLTWFTMLFAAGIGTILMFWGVAEPVSHFANPPFEGVQPGSERAASDAMTVALYHFGLHTWTIFAMPGLAIGYFAYRHNLPMRISSLFYPILGERAFGPWGWAVDVIAVLGTLFGVATSLGLGTLQLNSGLNYLFGIPSTGLVQVILIAVITSIAATSVALGLDKGVRRLSQLNIVLAIALLAFVLTVGPTVFIAEGMVQSVGDYLDALPWLAFWTQTFTETDWQRKWTLFYWAWTISWAPYVGIFIARISRGRTIREFVAGVLFAPTAFTLVWFGIFGLSAIQVEMSGQVALAEQVQQDPSVAIFAFLDALPLAGVASALSVVIIVIFFTTSSDSASLVIDMLTRRDDQPSLVRQRIFWALAQGVIAATLLLAGGLDALQNVITSLGLPFCILLIFMAVALFRALQADYRGYSMDELVQGRAFPEVEATSDTKQESEYVSETVDRH
ncbi:BCCT family transporter [Marinobacter halophilus]|uniref:Multidrug DMT transporter permease n=1 Tax=Marinobacter halophilus TaxID=1323740 RepID=A0A2T1KFW4_9GAMM|nr:BCCT family transporter [Marinobacter halophilus]PSF08442.1 multidrug DMT transporter permease [Marinobacter halophilus]GGC60625.1 multidrug DMT transporter permease [Marinobacter halophilus]